MQRAISKSTNPSKVHFYSSSGGNAGLGCVHAARFLGRPATVVVPMSTKPLMIAKIRAAGAQEVLQQGETWQHADNYLRESVMPAAKGRGEEPMYVHPFDHPDVWEGHGTMVEEMKAQLGESAAPDVIVCSVGGGGLFNGIMKGVQKVGWTDTTVLAMETVGADALAKSLEAGKHITIPGITSQATSLGAIRVCDKTWELFTKSKNAKNAVLTDAEAAMGSWRFADDERILVELACGVNVALCYGGRLAKALGRPVKPDDKVVIVVCGGSNITIDMINKYKQEFGLLDDDITTSEQQNVPSAAALTTITR